MSDLKFLFSVFYFFSRNQNRITYGDGAHKLFLRLIFVLFVVFNAEKISSAYAEGILRNESLYSTQRGIKGGKTRGRSITVTYFLSFPRFVSLFVRFPSEKGRLFVRPTKKPASIFIPEVLSRLRYKSPEITIKEARLMVLLPRTYIRRTKPPSGLARRLCALFFSEFGNFVFVLFFSRT